VIVDVLEERNDHLDPVKDDTSRYVGVDLDGNGRPIDGGLGICCGRKGIGDAVEGIVKACSFDGLCLEFDWVSGLGLVCLDGPRLYVSGFL
jgi:hypothetical protein